MAAVAMDRWSEKAQASGDGVGGAHAAPFAGKYAVLRVLGQGGMGTVFEARHLRLGHRVAIKVLGSELRDYPELVARFEREARAAGALSSPHAGRVFDIDMTEDGTPFIVMELLSGRDLAHVIEDEGPQPIGRAARWVIEACDAIGEAHRLGIVHRDVKPSNLFLCDGGGVKVLDFGIAKRVAAKEVSITQGVAPLGTPQYMSPEQVRCAKDVDARTDVWSLGVTLYELVTGRTPFAHAEPSACIASIAADPVPDPRTFQPELSEAFANVILRALEKKPSERYGSVEELVEALVPFATPDNGSLMPFAARPRLHSEDQETLGEEEASKESIALPLVAKASIRPRRRWHAPLGLATATILGLAALVLTPRCATKGIDTPATSVVQASMPSAATAGTAALIGKPEVVETAAAAASAPAVVELDAIPAAIAPAPTAPLASGPVLMGKPVLVKKVAPAKRAPDTANESHVHGGLSNPGF